MVEKFVPVIVSIVPPNTEPWRGDTYVTVEDVMIVKALVSRSPY